MIDSMKHKTALRSPPDVMTMGEPDINREPMCVVLEAPDFDVSPASEYGELVCIFNRVQHNAKMGDDFHRELITKLERADFDPDKDYLVVTGRTNVIAIAVAAMVLRWGRVSMLLYDPRTKSYQVKDMGDDAHER
jgi:hypothetical protein